MAATLTVGQMAQALNRPAIHVMHLQKTFDLPILEGAAYSPAYFALLRKLVHLHLLGISEKSLVELWKTEKHLLQLLHFDATGSPTWYLDECTHTRNPERRLLLTHHDLGPEILNRMLQPRLDFAVAPRALFSHKEVGDDARRVLERYHKLYADIQSAAVAEAAQLRNALRWFPRIRPPRKRSDAPR